MIRQPPALGQLCTRSAWSAAVRLQRKPNGAGADFRTACSTKATERLPCPFVCRQLSHRGSACIRGISQSSSGQGPHRRGRAAKAIDSRMRPPFAMRSNDRTRRTPRARTRIVSEARLRRPDRYRAKGPSPRSDIRDGTHRMRCTARNQAPTQAFPRPRRRRCRLPGARMQPRMRHTRCRRRNHDGACPWRRGGAFFPEREKIRFQPHRPRSATPRSAPRRATIILSMAPSLFFRFESSSDSSSTRERASVGHDAMHRGPPCVLAQRSHIATQE